MIEENGKQDESNLNIWIVRIISCLLLAAPAAFVWFFTVWIVIASGGLPSSGSQLTGIAQSIHRLIMVITIVSPLFYLGFCIFYSRLTLLTWRLKLANSMILTIVFTALSSIAFSFVCIAAASAIRI